MNQPTTSDPDFWTHHLQDAVAWYPRKDKATMVTAALIYETNSEKEGFYLTAGDVLTFNWAISQILPLSFDYTLLLEVAVIGYDSWQITDDSGRQARNPDVHDQVHGVGGPARTDLCSVGPGDKSPRLVRILC